jgi:hypothetical protein
MKFKKILVAFTILIFTSSTAYAQYYKTGIGAKLGASNGISVKHFVSETNAIEGILNSRWRGFNLTGLYQIHNPAFNTAGFTWYYGGGAHIGIWNGNDRNPWFDEDDRSYTVIGVDGVLGLEYKFNNAPFTLSMDWKPAVNLIGYTGAWLSEGGLAIRYVW